MVSSCHIRYVDDPAEWDQLVLASGGRLLQSWRWGEFKQRHGWYCLRLSITAADGVALAQILVRRILPFSILYIPRGPLVREFTEALPRAFHHVIQQLARQYRAIAVLAEPEDASGLTVLPRELGWKPSRFVIQPRRTLKVPLGDDTMLLEQMKPKTRYNVRLAFRRGVTTRIASHSEVERFYELLRETAERDRFGFHQIDYFRDLLTLFGEDAALLFAEFAGELAAGVLVVRYGDEAIYLYGASKTSLQRHMPTYAVQWAALQWARSHGCRWYDLWGIPDTDDPPPETDDEHLNVRCGLWGVYRFKSGFGGRPYTYPGVRELVRSPILMALWRRLRPLGA